jgi:hypothetical protein
LKIRTLIIGLAIGFFFVLALFFKYQGFYDYPDSFGPNFISALLGGALGAALSLLTVLISIVMERTKRNETLSPIRYFFLRREGEKLKESYDRFLSTIRVNSINQFKDKSWQSFDNKCWPDEKRINDFLSTIQKTSISETFDNHAVQNAYNQLRQSIEKVIEKTESGIFEGENTTVLKSLLEADYLTGSLWVEINKLGVGKVEQVNIDLSPAETPLKKTVTAVGQLLVEFCKLSKKVIMPII